MMPLQEAYSLMQQQPEGNVKLIIELLQRMTLITEEAAPLSFKRTGQAKGLVQFPEDFDEHFDDLNDEISALFEGGLA